MHIERFSNDFLAVLSLADSEQREQQMARFLEAHGYLYGARSATNIFLILPHLTPEALHRIVVASLRTSSPDMALNSFERLVAVVPHNDLLEVISRKKRLSQLIQLCGSSPFIVNIIFKTPSLLRLLLLDNAIDISRTGDEMLSALRLHLEDSTDVPGLLKLLRCFKRAEILRIAARDLNGLASLEEVTLELSHLAAASLQVGYEVCRRCLIKEYGTPLMITDNGQREALMTVIGMGKLGGLELNFSSDIDIIYFYESDKGETTGVETDGGELKGVVSLHTFFNKLGEMISRALSLVTEDGFVFRVDVGLRPEGKSGDMAVSLRSAEIYYESWGQSWERTAMLKARPVAGSIELGELLLRTLHPFVYRKYLDYNLIEDMKNMKLKIDATLAYSTEGETNLKLGRGGIREIEFFIQALQLVYSGKNQRIRERNSLKALDALLNARLINDDDHLKLSGAYRFLRTVEHRIQVVQERQTHNLPLKEEELVALARRCGYLRQNGLERFQETLEEHRVNVSNIYGNLFHSGDADLKEELKPETLFILNDRSDADLVKDMLAERNFDDVEQACTNLRSLRVVQEKANITERRRRILEKILPLLVQESFESPDPDMALANIERFVTLAGSRSSCFALLAENRDTLKRLVSLFGMSKFLSRILLGHLELLDSMVTNAADSVVKTGAMMKSELDSLLAQAEDFEERLDVLRRYRNEEFLRIGMNDAHGRLGQSEITSQLTLLGEACLAAAYSMAVVELKRFGLPVFQNEEGEFEAGLAVVGMGKLGGGDLNYHSDLDIIFVYDRQGNTNGEKQISNHEYFAKLGQKIISILTMQTREGYVYKIDTRLRPSGNAGPLVTSLDSFLDYHRKEAQIWERQALTKARMILGGELLAMQLDEVIRHAVYSTSITEEGRNEIHRLRMRMENEIAREKDGNYNIKTGRGGVVDVEFTVQYLQLKYGCHYAELRTTSTIVALKEIRILGIIAENEADTLLSGFKFLRKLENRLRIINDNSVNDLGGTKAYLNKLARRLGYDHKLKNPGAALICDYEETTGKIRECYARILGEGVL